MLRIKWVVAVAVALVAAGGARATDETYDLRGPAPEVNQKFVSKATMTIKDADTTMKVAGQTINVKMTIVENKEEEAKVLAVKDRDVTKCQTKVIKEKADFTLNVAGMDMEHSETAALEGETVISEKDGKKWKHVLVDTKASAKQKKELDARTGIENDDPLYPTEKVKVGHTWTADAAALAKLLDATYTDVKGKVDQKFVKVENLNGEQVAVIESAVKLTAKKTEDGEPVMDVELDLKVTTWKSLKTGVSVKEKFSGKTKMAGTIKMDDMKVEMTLAGAISGEGTTKLVAAK